MKTIRHLRLAKFRYGATIEEIDFTSTRGLDKTHLLRLADTSFISKKENILITGATGVGKSYLASALGHQTCQSGYRTLHFNTQKLFTKLKMLKADGSFTREIQLAGNVKVFMKLWHFEKHHFHLTTMAK